MPLPISIHWDYYDQVYEYGDVYGRDAMRKLCADAKAAGVESINFRPEGAGMSWVPTQTREVFDRYDPNITLPFADFSRITEKINHEERIKFGEIFKRTYQTVPDPLTVACEAAREVGLKLNIYICPLDQYFPGIPNTLVEKMPGCCIASRDGQHKLAVASLAYPEVRAWLLDYYREIFTHDFADVVVYPNCHAWYSYPLDVADDWFGFEDPAVEDYGRATGIDVRNDPFDIDDYYTHYGTYWTMLLKELADMQKQRGGRLIVGMDMGQWQVYLPWGAGRPRCTWRWRNDWRTWTQWGNVDLCVGHQVNMWTQQGWPGNQLPYMPGSNERPPYQHAEEIFGKQGQRDFALWSFLTLHHDKAQEELALAFEGTRAYGYDGLMMRETADFEFKIGWQSLQPLMV